MRFVKISRLVSISKLKPLAHNPDPLLPPPSPPPPSQAKFKFKLTFNDRCEMVKSVDDQCLKLAGDRLPQHVSKRVIKQRSGEAGGQGEKS